MKPQRDTLVAQMQGALQLQIAYIGIVNGLLPALKKGPLRVADLSAATHMDAGYVTRWSDAAYAFDLIDETADGFVLRPLGEAFLPDTPGTFLPFAVQSILSAHMAERAAGLMRTGERPGESVLAERDSILPWFGPMLEAQFGPLFADDIAPRLTLFADIDRRGGLVVDLGCGNGWYLLALARRYRNLRGLGLDGFGENVAQAQQRAQAEGVGQRLRFAEGDIYQFVAPEPVAAFAMTRALHHVWDERERVLERIRDQLMPGGAAIFWEPNWPATRQELRDPQRRVLAFQNLTEHVQGNHFLQADEIAQACRQADLEPSIHLFAGGKEAVIVATRAAAGAGTA